MGNKSNNNSKKWKPKQRWTESATIDPKTGKIEYKYFTPESPEEEKELEDGFNQKMMETAEATLAKRFD